jgi:RNA polymerase sigma-70 factor (ECF subfamily)
VGYADAAAADDLTARIFERALANIDQYRPERRPFGVWLFAIARNAVSDHLRAQQRRRWLSLDVLRNQASARPQPEEVIVHDETCAELVEAIARLGDRERDIIALKFAAGLTNRRIARLCGLSASNVGAILYRTIRKLRDELEKR